MSDDVAGAMKARLRQDLRAAIKDKRAVEVKVIRTLVAAIDNAEAPAKSAEWNSPLRAGCGSTEVERLLLNDADIRNVLLAEMREREHAAVEMDRLELTDRADDLRTQACLIARYIERQAI